MSDVRLGIPKWDTDSGRPLCDIQDLKYMAGTSPLAAIQRLRYRCNVRSILVNALVTLYPDRYSNNSAVAAFFIILARAGPTL